MPEMLRDFLDWYLAPWRRIGRKEFGIALTVATLPGLALMVLGWGDSAGNFLEPVMTFMGMGRDVNAAMASGGNLADLQLGLERMQSGLTGMGSAPAVPLAHGFDWSGLVNGLCLLAMIPLGRMRLRDMGWYGWPEVVLTVVFNISVVEGLLQSLTGVDLLPLGALWGVLNFLGYGWLTFAKGKPRMAVHERIDETLAARDLQAKIDNEQRLNAQGHETRRFDDDY